jgi:hypothetical protein
MTGLLNLSSERVAVVARSVSPLVVDVGHGCYEWVQSGLRFSLDTRAAGTWHVTPDAVGLGGRVLTVSQVDALVAVFGRPTP